MGYGQLVLPAVLTKFSIGGVSVGVGEQVVVQPTTTAIHQCCQTQTVQCPQHDMAIVTSRGQGFAIRVEFKS